MRSAIIALTVLLIGSSMADQLVNGHGKCLASSANGAHNGNGLIQWDCLPDEKGQNWKLANNHLCNLWGKCVAVGQNLNIDTHLIQWDPLNEEGQSWAEDLDDDTIVNGWGRCLGVDGDSSNNGANIVAIGCNNQLKSQEWRFK